MAVAVILVLAEGAGSFAQEKPVPPRREVRVQTAKTDTSGKLPEMALPEFDILGVERILLDSGNRSIADERWQMRNTTLNDYDNRGPYATLPKDGAGTPAASTGITGRAEGGVGSYATPYYDLRMGLSSGDVGFLLESGYETSAGYDPNTGYRTGYVTLSGGAGITEPSILPGTLTLGGEVGLEGSAYRLFGSDTPDRLRSLNALDFSGRIEGTVDSSFSYDVGLDVASFSVEDTLISDEVAVELKSAARKRIGDLSVSAVADLWRNAYRSPSTGQDPFHNTFSADARFSLLDNLEVEAGASAYVLRGSSGGSRTLLYPSAGVSWRPDDWVGLSARFSPATEKPLLSTLLDRSPYIVNDVDLVTEEIYSRFVLGGEFNAGSLVKASVAFRYQHANNTPLYVEQGKRGVWDVSYAGVTRTFAVAGAFTANPTSQDRLVLSFDWRNTKNSVTGGAIPYLPSFGLNAVVRHEFPFGLAAETAFLVRGTQFTDTGNRQALPSYLVWDLGAEYAVMSPLRIGLSLRNITDQDQEQWQGYRGVPRSLTLYARYHW
jgi:outer membrane receptor protein involved in Fe transport